MALILSVMLYYSCSIFDSNSAPDAAAINLVYYNAVLKNITFVNHTGSTLRVSEYQFLLPLYITLYTYVIIKGDYWKS